MRIYCVTHGATGKSYVGKTIKALSVRWAEHCRSKQDTLLVMAIRKHGAAAFSVEELATAGSAGALNLLEREWISRLGTLYPGGYNLMPGGEGGPHSDVTVAKLRRMAADPAFKARQRAGLRRFWDDPENRQRAVAALAAIRRDNFASGKRHRSHQAAWDKTRTPDWIARRSALQKEIWQRPEYRAKLAAARERRLSAGKEGSK